MRVRSILLGALLCLVGLGISVQAARMPLSSPAVQDVMDGVVTRLYDTLDPKDLMDLDQEKVLRLLTDHERLVLSDQFWCFTANVPVTVSVMRNDEQTVAPFWLEERGFAKIDMLVKNEEFTYEVWQKAFDAGPIGLGINGFDRHRSCYFICVGPQNPGDELSLSSFVPEAQPVSVMREGATIYHDWDELVLTEVPETLRGQTLLSTIRGRSREAHLVGAFRRTAFPSSKVPDQILLTWRGDPRETQTLQWRTAPTQNVYVVRYSPVGQAGSWKEMPSQAIPLEDRLLVNDRVILRHTVSIVGLSPGSDYDYCVGTPEGKAWSRLRRFRTASTGADPFSFIYLSDTHNSKMSGQLLRAAFKHSPNSAFYAISGDLVGTGLYRTDWDLLFHEQGSVLGAIPILPCLGNHDDQEGLGASMYLDLFALPEQGPQGMEPERAYAVTYSNALILVLDVTSDLMPQAEWMEEILSRSQAVWKFAVFHFPPYNAEEDYPDIQAAWGTLFDRYHVDVALTGHVHTYQRTKPMRAGRVVDSPREGTVYVTSVATDTRSFPIPLPEYANVVFSGVPTYQIIEVKGEELRMKAMDRRGKVRDELVIQKGN